MENGLGRNARVHRYDRLELKTDENFTVAQWPNRARQTGSDDQFND